MHNIIFISLGCDKNLVDSEVMLGMLAGKGYSFTDDEEKADIAVINTCCFIGDAKEESIGAILEMAKRKKTGQLKALLVAGCLAQRYKEEIRKEIGEVDAILGTTALDAVVDAVEQVLAGEKPDCFRDVNKRPEGGRDRMMTTGGCYSYLKIAEGCDKHCTYCIIPSVRGSYRSIPMEQLLTEAGRLAAQGVKELILVAQETTLYGLDLYGEKKLPELLRRLCRIEGFRFIRILYCYPEEITPELIEVIRTEEKICHYLDLPIQHASDTILRRMGRKTDNAGLRSAIGELRRQIPDICIRTTLISGFPGETKEDHELLMDFVREMRFDRLGVFCYSPEEGTPAARMPGQVRERTKKKRQAQLMELQQSIAFEDARKMTGREIDAVVEGKVADEDVYAARTYKDAPGVDGLVFIHADARLLTGDFVKVRVTGAHEYDLLGELA